MITDKISANRQQSMKKLFVSELDFCRLSKKQILVPVFFFKIRAVMFQAGQEKWNKRFEKFQTNFYVW